MATVTTSLDQNRIVSMIDIASRDTTHEGEAINALRLVRRDLNRAGVDLVNIIHLNPKGTNGVVRETITMLRKQNAELAAALEAKDKEIAHLTQHIRESAATAFVLAVEAANSKTDDTSISPDVSSVVEDEAKEFYTWIDFCNAGTARFGKSKGFQQAFIEAYPDFEWGTVSGWRRLNKVPAKAMELVKTMPVVLDSTRGKDWTETERDFLRTTLSENPKIRMDDLAKLLSTQFGRTISEGAAKAAKHRALS